VKADLAIVGGGPVGLGVAIHASRRGLSSVVIESRKPPLDKACGEGLMPAGVAALRELGIALPGEAGVPLAGIRYVDGDTVAQGHFLGGAGLGVRRTVLSDALVRRAQETGATLVFGCRVTGWTRLPGRGVRVETDGGAVKARVLVGADGLRSRVRRSAGLEAGAGRGRLGARRHVRIAPWSGFVEVYWGEGIEAYVTPVGPEEVGIALLWGGGGAPFDRLLARLPALTRRLAGVPHSTSMRGAGPFHQRVAQRWADRVALVGDAAGYLDPLTGEGITLGLRCAAALVDVVARGAPLSEYERAYRRLSASYYRMTRLLLLLAACPPLRRRVIGMLARDPDVFDQMLAVNAGQIPLDSIGVSAALRLAGGLIV